MVFKSSYRIELRPMDHCPAIREAEADGEHGELL